RAARPGSGGRRPGAGGRADQHSDPGGALMAAYPQTMHFLTPTYRPAGGVVKVFDYLVHALELGYETDVHCPYPLRDDDRLFSVPRFARLREDPRVHFHEGL